jgi:hypothetical protein
MEASHLDDELNMRFDQMEIIKSQLEARDKEIDGLRNKMEELKSNIAETQQRGVDPFSGESHAEDTWRLQTRNAEVKKTSQRSYG